MTVTAVSAPDAARRQAFVDALRPRRDGRPTIAIVALNEGTETTDLLLTHAVLRRADVAEVRVVAPRAGHVDLYPALAVDGAQAFDEFDRQHPDGADYVIVPAMRVDDDAAVTGWLARQARRGTRVIGVCSGARIVGRAGLLDGRRFTGHWYDRGKLLQRHPGTTHVPDQRYLVDRDVATTTGITASIPTMLALVEAIGGRARAAALAAGLGVDDWSPAHDSARFALDARRRWAYVADRLAFWRGSEHRRIDVAEGTDDIALALAVDAWSRTGRVRVATAAASESVEMRSGLRLVVDEPGVAGAPYGSGGSGPAEARAEASAAAPRIELTVSLPPVRQLDRTLCEIAERYGEARRERVMLEMEYARLDARCGAG